MKLDSLHNTLLNHSNFVYQNHTPGHIESQESEPDAKTEINELKIQIEAELKKQENTLEGLQAKFKGVKEWLQNDENTQNLTVGETKSVIQKAALENNTKESVIADAMGLDWAILDFMPDEGNFKRSLFVKFSKRKQQYIDTFLEKNFSLNISDLAISSQIYLKELFFFEDKDDSWEKKKESIQYLINNPNFINAYQLSLSSEKNEHYDAQCKLEFLFNISITSPRYREHIDLTIEEINTLKNSFLSLDKNLRHKITQKDNILSNVYMDLFQRVNSGIESPKKIINLTNLMGETNHPNFHTFAELPIDKNSYQTIKLAPEKIISFSNEDIAFLKSQKYPALLFKETHVFNPKTGEDENQYNFLGETKEERDKINFLQNHITPKENATMLKVISKQHLLDNKYWNTLEEKIIQLQENNTLKDVEYDIFRFTEILHVFQYLNEDIKQNISAEEYSEIQSFINNNDINSLGGLVGQTIQNIYENNTIEFYNKYLKSNRISPVAYKKINAILDLDKWEYIYKKHGVDIERTEDLHILSDILTSEPEESYIHYFLQQKVGKKTRFIIQQLTIQDEESHRPARERLKAVAGFNAKDVYALIIHGEREFDADAFKPLFDGYSRSEKRFDKRTLMGKIMTQFDGNGYDFLKHVDPELKDLPTFFNMLSRYNRLDKFFLTLQNPKELKTVLQKLIEHASEGSSNKQFGNMVAISEILEKLSGEIPMEEGITVYAQALSKGMKKQKRQKFKRIIRKIENGIELTAVEKKRFGEDIKDAFGNVRKNTISIIERSIYEQANTLQQEKENTPDKWQQKQLQEKINLLKILASEHVSHEDESGNAAHHLQNKRIDFVVSIEDTDPNKLIDKEAQKALESDIDVNEYSTIFAEAGLDYNEIKKLPHTSTDTQKGLDFYQREPSLVSNIQLQKIIKEMRQELILDEVNLSYKDLQKLPYETSVSAGLEAYQRSDLYKDNVPFQEIITELIQERQLSDATADFFLEAAEEIQLPNVEKLEEEALFGKDNVQNQFHYFYNDNDGRASFRHFISTYEMATGNIRHRKKNNPINKKNGWKGWSEGAYIVLQKKDEQSGRTVNMYVVDPKQNNANKGNKALQELNDKEGITPETVVHRGHSFHAKKTIDDIPDSSILVNLGSCGGYSNVSDALDKASGAHVLSTTGTGVMAVNDPVFKAMNEWMLKKGNINWNNFEQSMNAKFKVHEDKTPANRVTPSRNQRMYANYTFPHKNKAIVLKQIWEKMKNISE